MARKLLIILTVLFIIGSFGLVRIAISQEREVAGTFFGDNVSKDNYFLMLRIVLSYSSPWGRIPKNRQQLEKRVWDDLILSYEVHRRQISVGHDELEKRISETLEGNKVSFNWKESPDEYAQWVEKKFGVSVKVFENQMQHLAQVKILHGQVLDSINPAVTEKEAFEEFLNEQNSLSVELAEFDELEDAQEFYDKVKENLDLWEQYSKKDSERAREDRAFRCPGLVSLEFLMEMWKFPKKAVFEMVTMKIGDIYPPEPIYQGYGVFKILDVRRADESMFLERKESYFEQLRSRKKYQGFDDWLKNLKKEADIQVYIEPPSDIFL